jgi:hypothetical protein
VRTRSKLQTQTWLRWRIQTYHTELEIAENTTAPQRDTRLTSNDFFQAACIAASMEISLDMAYDAQLAHKVEHLLEKYSRNEIQER